MDLIGVGPWHLWADRSDLDEVGDDLLDKEGIAFGFRADCRRYGYRNVHPGSMGHHFRYAFSIETGEVDPLESPLPA